MRRQRAAKAAAASFLVGAAIMWACDRFLVEPAPRAAEDVLFKAPHAVAASPPTQPAGTTPHIPAALDLSQSAFVSMASGDEAGMMALVLMQSLRDVGTAVPNLVLMLMRGGKGSANCLDPAWKSARNRTDVRCDSLETEPAEIVSEYLLERLQAIGVQLLVTDPVPPTDFTSGSHPGATAWCLPGAFDKLRVFSLAQFRKAVWLAPDAYIVRNVDHLMALPALTGSVVTACCHPQGPAYPGTSMWVLEPSAEMYDRLMGALRRQRPGTIGAGWAGVDKALVRQLFGMSLYDGAPECVGSRGGAGLTAAFSAGAWCANPPCLLPLALPDAVQAAVPRHQ